jgi:hypothetical protein
MVLSLVEAGAQLVSQPSGPGPQPDDFITIVSNPDKSSLDDEKQAVAGDVFTCHLIDPPLTRSDGVVTLETTIRWEDWDAGRILFRWTAAAAWMFAL